MGECIVTCADCLSRCPWFVLRGSNCGARPGLPTRASAPVLCRDVQRRRGGGRSEDDLLRVSLETRIPYRT